MHTKRLQRGVASVETILLVPFMLLLITLIISSARYSSHIIHNTIDARTSAWREALFNNCSNTLEPRFGGAYQGSNCTGSSRNADIYLTSLMKGPEAAMFTGVLRSSGVPKTTTATANSSFNAFLIQDSFSVTITDQHSLDAMPAWERRHMPIGYNSVLPRMH